MNQIPANDAVVATTNGITRGEVILEATDLVRRFTAKGEGGLFAPKKTLVAVDRVSLALRAGEVVAIVGESGSGKSVLSRLLARIITPSAGTLALRGTPIDLRSRRTTAYANEVQLVLQDPFASINPVRRVGRSLERPLRIHGTPKDQVQARAYEVLESVSLTPPQQYLDRFPHELSGGQLQRVNIARGLSVRPKVLLADEPISMLDVSVRLGVLNLLRELCDAHLLAMMYITHDIASARYIADETAVMYAGQVVERGRGTVVIDAPVHPYTQLLVSSVPDPDQLTHQEHRATTANAVGFNLEGCRFSPRCPHATELCHTSEPPMVELEDGHSAKCWLVADAAQRTAVSMRPGPSSEG